jgi:hypothetical protein
MSTTYLQRQKITLENGLITLHWATFDSNVSPQPGPGFGSRSSDFTVCAQVAASDQMAIRELFEEICREMDGGCLKHRREWINGGAAWVLWQTVEAGDRHRPWPPAPQQDLLARHTSVLFRQGLAPPGS